MPTSTRRAVTLGLAVLAAPLLAAPLLSGPTLAQAASAPRRRFGVQTHFAQGEATGLLGQLSRNQLPFDFVRDEIYWAHLEDRRPGDFNWAYSDAYIDEISRAGKKLLLVVDWSNPLFHAMRPALHPHAPRNGIYMPDTPEERAGFATYVMAVLERYAKPGGPRYRAGLFEGIEVWNEANGSWSGDFPIRPGPGGLPEALVALTREVHARVRADKAFDAIPILGGACIRIPLNYAKWLLDAGLGEAIDGFVVHPYMSAEEAMRDAAALRHMLDARELHRVQIWATEFGNSHTPSLFLQMLAALLASPLAGTSYYLAQSHHGAEFGLLDAGGRITDVGRAYAAWVGRFERLSFVRRLPSQPKTYLLEFDGEGGRLVVGWSRWGRTRLVLHSGQTARDALGRSVPTTGGGIDLRDQAVAISGGGDIKEDLGGEHLLADSFADFAIGGSSNGWTYLGRHGDDVQPLTIASDQYCDFLTLHGAGPARLDASGAHPGRLGREPVAVVRRYTATKSAEVIVRGQVSRAERGGDGTGVAVQAGGVAVLPRSVLRDTRPVSFEQRLNLRSGDTVDLITDPGPAGDLAFDRVDWQACVYGAG